MSTSQIEIRLLGRLEISVDGKPIPEVRVKKGRLLLGYLIIRAVPISRSQVAEMLWPESYDDVARYNLRQLLGSVRKDLGDLGSRLAPPGSQDLSFDVSDCWIDLVEFRRNLLGDPEEAVALYRGPLLEGVKADWLDGERATVDAAYHDAMEILSGISDPKTSLDWLRKLVEADPLRDTAQQKLIMLLTESGDLSGARKAYRKYEDTCRRELGCAPSSDTKRLLEEHISASLSGAPTAKARNRAPNNLPEPLTSFVGRGREIGQIETMLAHARLLTLTGSGGCGKTRLALQVATGTTDSYRDGVWFLELASLSEPHPVPQAAAALFGLKEVPGKPILEILTDYLKARQLLLVLDNCEHLIPACCSLVSGILRTCPHVKVPATGRETLGITGEQTFRVPSLSLPSPKESYTPKELTQYEAVQLFVERSILASTDFELTEANAQAVAQVYLKLDGIPLAIELAAARMRSMKPEDVKVRLDHRFRLLVGGDRTALPRHQTLQNLIDWSYDLLSKTEKAMLRGLSGFAGGWDLKAAERICMCEGIDEVEVFHLLTSLVDKSLVIAEPLAGGVRYRLLETMRQYAGALLRESGEEESWRSRHFAYFLSLTEDIEPKLYGADQLCWLDRLETEHDNLRAALAWSLEPGNAHESGLDMTRWLWRFWSVRGYFGEGRKWIAGLLHLIPEGECLRARAYGLISIASFAKAQGDREESQLLLEKSLAIRREIGDRSGAGSCLSDLGNLLWAMGNSERGRSCLEESLAIFRELGDQRRTAIVLGNLAVAILDGGDCPTARSLLEESVAISRALGNRFDLAISLSRIGDVAIAEGDFSAAQSFHTQGLEIKRELGDLGGVAYSFEGMGTIAFRVSDGKRAAFLWGAAERLRDELGGGFLIENWSHSSERAAYGHDSAFDAAWAKGRAMTTDEAIDYASRPLNETRFSHQPPEGQRHFLAADGCDR